MPETTADLSAYMQSARAAIETALWAYTEFDGDCPERLRAAIRHSLLAQGKRLRPVLTVS